MLIAIGMIGLALMLIGWLYETYHTIKDGHCDVKLSFAGLYFIGSILLAYYAFVLNDTIFLILNIAAAVVSLVNIYFIFFGEKHSAEYYKLLKKVKRKKK